MGTGEREHCIMGLGSKHEGYYPEVTGQPRDSKEELLPKLGAQK